jgi:hypothetical protein
MISCTSLSDQKTNIDQNQNSSKNLDNNKFDHASNNLDFEQVDKENIEDGVDYIKHTNYDIKIYKPADWSRFPAQSEHTILKVANKKLGAQVSLNRLRDINTDFTESDLDYKLNIFLDELVESGVRLQNVIKQKTIFKGCKAIRLDATFILYQGNNTLVEKFISYQFIRDNILYTLTATFPEILIAEVGYSVDKILNSLTFEK